MLSYSPHFFPCWCLSVLVSTIVHDCWISPQSKSSILYPVVQGSELTISPQTLNNRRIDFGLENNYVSFFAYFCSWKIYRKMSSLFLPLLAYRTTNPLIRPAPATVKFAAAAWLLATVTSSLSLGDIFLIFFRIYPERGVSISSFTWKGTI